MESYIHSVSDEFSSRIFVPETSSREHITSTNVIDGLIMSMGYLRKNCSQDLSLKE
ncbi:MAG: hypothetical protein R2942_01265 [Ignavibacteria bacterium]